MRKLLGIFVVAILLLATHAASSASVPKTKIEQPLKVVAGDSIGVPVQPIVMQVHAIECDYCAVTVSESHVFTPYPLTLHYSCATNGYKVTKGHGKNYQISTLYFSARCSC
jgi:biotin carboxylase